MRYAIIADIHANLAALTAVLEDIQHRGGMEKVWFLGDVVGYGPEPHQCLELLRQTDHIGVAGNNDLAAIGKVDTADFNPEAAAACHWTAQQLTSADIEYLGQLPLVIEEGDFTLVHGSPRQPIWEYLSSTDVAQENLAYFKSPFCLVGHSHLPLVFNDEGNGSCSGKPLLNNDKLTLAKNRLMINPGSVGQPRDGDPRASYALYDSETRRFRLYRVPYDIRSTQKKMIEYDLPMRLATRLSYGW
ncbi:MAG: Metallophosphoesterase [Dehalococcoidales bacterium]|nr:Metallophosphoesterase [Dehalococcoidales bacterium]